MKSVVKSRGYTTIPSRILKDHHIRPQTKLEWIDDGDTIRVIPIPIDPIRAARGLTKGLRRKLIRSRDLERQRA